MTDKMQCCMNHIKTAMDVDPWAKEMIVKTFAAIQKIQERIEQRLESERDYNEKLNRASNFQMTYEIANVSGKIGGKKWCLEVMEECLQEVMEW